MTCYRRPRPDKRATQFRKFRARLRRRDLQKLILTLPPSFLRTKKFSHLSLHTQDFLKIYLLFCIQELSELGLFNWHMKNCFGGKEQDFGTDYETQLLEDFVIDPSLILYHSDQFANHKCIQLRPYANETQLLL